MQNALKTSRTLRQHPPLPFLFLLVEWGCCNDGERGHESVDKAFHYYGLCSHTATSVQGVQLRVGESHDSTQGVSRLHPTSFDPTWQRIVLRQSSNRRWSPLDVAGHMLKSSSRLAVAGPHDVISSRKHSSAASDLGRIQHSEKSFSPELDGLDLIESKT